MTSSCEGITAFRKRKQALKSVICEMGLQLGEGNGKNIIDQHFILVEFIELY